MSAICLLIYHALFRDPKRGKQGEPGTPGMDAPWRAYIKDQVNKFRRAGVSEPEIHRYRLVLIPDWAVIASAHGLVRSPTVSVGWACTDSQCGLRGQPPRLEALDDQDEARQSRDGIDLSTTPNLLGFWEKGDTIDRSSLEKNRRLYTSCRNGKGRERGYREGQ